MKKHYILCGIHQFHRTGTISCQLKKDSYTCRYVTFFTLKLDAGELQQWSYSDWLPPSSNHNIGASSRAARALLAAPHRAQHYTQFAILRNAILWECALILTLFLIGVMSCEWLGGPLRFSLIFLARPNLWSNSANKKTYLRINQQLL
jgi:hypothetical protein